MIQSNGSEIDQAGFEAELFRRIGQGDRQAFNDLYARYSRPLFSYAFNLLRDRMAAEEVLQDAFVKIWKTASRYDPSLSRPFSWAVLVTKRLCIDRLRRLKPETLAEDPTLYQRPEDRLEEDQTPSERAAVNEEVGRLRCADRGFLARKFLRPDQHQLRKPHVLHGACRPTHVAGVAGIDQDDAYGLFHRGCLCLLVF